MVLAVESAVLCALFTLMVCRLSRDPLKTLYNYPPRIQARVRSLEQYRGRIPTKRDRRRTKAAAALCFALLLALLLRYVNACRHFWEAFGTGFLLWTAVNLWDLAVLDILWFCHDPRYVLPGTEDMVSDYHDYRFHLRGFLIGEALALAVCALAAAVAALLP